MLIEYKPHVPALPVQYRRGSAGGAKARRGPVIYKGDGAVYWPIAGGYTLIDEADVPRVRGNSWRRSTQPHVNYARHSGSGAHLHNLLLGCKGVDHINGDGLDNRRCNLRPATRSQNQGNRKRARNNTSGLRGVRFDRQKNRWRAALQTADRRLELGSFATAEEAVAAFARAAKERFGEYYADRAPLTRRIGDPLAFVELPVDIYGM